MSGKTGIDDSDLHALLDGALDSDRSRIVAAEIAADPVLADRFDGFKADKDMLKAVYGPLAGRPLPEAWLDRIAAARPAPKWSWRGVAAIAAVLLLALAGTLAYRSLGTPGSGEIVADALQARQKPEAPPIPLTRQADAVRYTGTLSQMVAVHVKVPDLRRMGYRLTAMRLYPALPGKGAAELRYRDDSGRIFTLYLRHSDGTARFDQFERAGLRVCVWQDDQLGMVMAGDVSTAAMQRLASLAYTGLTL